MHAKIRLLGVLLVAGLVLPAGGRASALHDDLPAEAEVESSQRFTKALEERIAGKAGLGDVRVDLFWSPRGRATTVRIFGTGVGVWNRDLQFHLSRAQVLGILRAVEKAHFAAMPDQFGEDEGGEKHEKNEGPRLKGRLIVVAGPERKGSLQLVDGEQSAAFARLIEKILEVCEGPARKGLRAGSMRDAIGLLASGRLAPEIFEAVVQRRPDPKAPSDAAAAWTLKVEGLHVGEQAGRSLSLSKKEFHDLAALLAETEPSALPQSLYSASYVDVTLAALGYSRTIAGRRFLGMTPESNGEKQKAFDRIVAAFDALHARLAREGSP